MSSGGAKHTWVFDQDSRLLRFYVTVWCADPAKADFCKLFWSVVLAPVGLVGRASIAIGSRIWCALRRREPKRRVLKDGPGLPERLGDTLSSPKVRKGAEVAFDAMLVLYGGGMLGCLLVLLYAIALIGDAWQTLQWTVFAIGCCAILAACVWLLVRLEKRGTLRRAGRFMADGYRSVKSNTCPRIVVRATEDARA